MFKISKYNLDRKGCKNGIIQNTLLYEEKNKEEHS